MFILMHVAYIRRSSSSDHEANLFELSYDNQVLYLSNTPVRYFYYHRLEIFNMSQFNPLLVT